MVDTNRRKAGFINFLALFIEPYRYRKINLDKKKVQRLLSSILLSSLTVIAIIILDNTLNPYHPTPIPLSIIWIYLAITLSISFTFVLILNDNKIARNYWILIAWMILAFTFKRFHFPLAGILIMTSFLILALGNFFLFYRYLKTIRGNNYLKIVASIAALILAFTSLSIVTKYQHWPGQSFFQALSLFPMLLLTLIVLTTLPNSGFISWSKNYKEIITKRILIPWVFLLLFIAAREVLPSDISNKIFSKSNTEYPAFFMNDYEIDFKEIQKADQ